MKINYIGQFEIISFYDLEISQQNEVKDNYENIEESSFFVDDNNEVHDLNDFMRINYNNNLKSFHGYNSTSFFHSYLVILSDYGNSVKLFNSYS